MAAIRSRLTLLALTLSACRAEPEAAPLPVEEAVAGHCEQRLFEGSGFTACRYDADEHELRLVLGEDSAPLRSFAALEANLGDRAGQLLFAMNAGMYDEAGMPIGLYVEEGRERHTVSRRDGPGNFHLKPNGVFAAAADGSVAIVATPAWPAEPPPRWATQSGPMLILDGRLHPGIQPNGDSLYVRNGVGVADGRTAWFAISDEPVSFGRFARFFRDSLGCGNALYLDGAVSSLWDPGAGRRDGRDSLGPLVAVFRRAAPDKE
ncbi:MAG TPA: phosphodiester glycosidase family protein [Allosphingosinicella sp.]|nr:phosphodiester glycosidase family protein [Allosphingosinicella sp.]